MPVQILRQHLVTVDVSREDCGETEGKIRTPNHIGRVSESEIGGAHRSSFDAVVHA